MNRSASLALALWVLIGTASTLCGQVPVTWDGGNGAWNAAKWNGGQTATATMGNDRGGDGNHAITIGGGSQVTYDAGSLRDFHPQIQNGPNSLTIKGGSSLTINSFNTDVDGVWTQFDSDLILDNGTYRRTWTAGGSTVAGGLNLFGSWRSKQNQKVNISLTNGGRIENDGQVWFGADEEHALGLKVLMNINNGTVDLTGGTYPESNDSNIVTADLAFFYGTDQGDGDGNSASGLPKGETYKVGFEGPGSVTVDHSGIWVYREDASGLWTATQSTYQDLWTQGILRSDGGSGGYGLDFNNFFTVTGTSGSDNYKVTRKDPAAVVWDGGNGAWEAAKWNGGQTAAATMGNNRGGDGGHAISIGGGAQVTYDAGSLRDLHPQIQNGANSLTIKEGAKLTINTFNSDVDGVWTQFDSDLTLNNGTFKRTWTAGGSTVAGGVMMLGSWRSREGQQIDVNITNGGRLENDGQLWFGADEEHGLNVQVHVTVNNGTIDLTGGTYPESNDSNIVKADLAFFFGTDQGDGNGNSASGLAKNEDYTINFTGSGSLTVDHSGIWVYREDAGGLWTATQSTYQDLWNAGILQANGLSGLTGASFSTYFSTTGTSGADNYTLTSLLAGLQGDFNGDHKVDGADFLVWQRGFGTTYNAGDLATWKAHFGQTGSVGAASGVPEPAALCLACLAMGVVLARGRRQN
jgi:hypothetical protein